MRTLVTIVLIILVMVVAGWLAFSFTGNTAKVEFRTDAVKRDVDNAVQRTEQIIKGIGNETVSSPPPLVSPSIVPPNPTP